MVICSKKQVGDTGAAFFLQFHQSLLVVVCLAWFQSRMHQLKSSRAALVILTVEVVRLLEPKAAPACVLAQRRLVDHERVILRTVEPPNFVIAKFNGDINEAYVSGVDAGIGSSCQHRNGGPQGPRTYICAG